MSQVLPSSQNGSFSTNAVKPYPEGTRATLTCNNGFASKTAFESILKKTKNGFEWDPPSIDCVPSMHTLPSTPHGTFLSSVVYPYVEGNKATLTCDAGYTSKTGFESILKNTSTGLQWDPLPKCVASLNNLPTATHGDFTSAEAPPYVAGNKATLTCHNGYTSKIGVESTLTSIASGLMWAPPSIDCVPSLNDLPTMPNGEFTSMDTAPYVEGNKATLKCDADYTFSTNELEAVAETDNNLLKWVLPSATCVSALKALPLVKGEGEFKSDQVAPYILGNEARLECPPGYLTQNVKSTVTFHNNQLQWVPPTATCIPVACAFPLDIDHAKKTVHKADGSVRLDGGFSFTDRLVYTCEEGYSLNPPNTGFYCSATGQVTPAIPGTLHCAPIQCPPPEIPLHASLTGREYDFGKIVKVVCDPGYTLATGNGELTCLADKTWGGDATCIPIECPELQAPLNGNVSFSNRNVNGEATFTCNDSYEIGQGDSRRLCLHTGVWTGTSPNCIPIPQPQGGTGAAGPAAAGTGSTAAGTGSTAAGTGSTAAGKGSVKATSNQQSSSFMFWIYMIIGALVSGVLIWFGMRFWLGDRRTDYRLALQKR